MKLDVGKKANLGIYHRQPWALSVAHTATAGILNAGFTFNRMVDTIQFALNTKGQTERQLNEGRPRVRRWHGF